MKKFFVIILFIIFSSTPLKSEIIINPISEGNPEFFRISVDFDDQGDIVPSSGITMKEFSTSISSNSLAFIKDDNLAIESSDSEPLSLELIKYKFFAFKDMISERPSWITLRKELSLKSEKLDPPSKSIVSSEILVVFCI